MTDTVRNRSSVLARFLRTAVRTLEDKTVPHPADPTATSDADTALLSIAAVAEELDAVAIAPIVDVSAAVARMRARNDVAIGEGQPLRGALIGQHSDALFCTQWDKSKAVLCELLDVLDSAYPPDPAVPRG